MGLRFYRRIRLGPGLRLNLSRSGTSVTAGETGAHVTIGPRGVGSSVGLPGTGLSYRSQTSQERGGAPGTGSPPLSVGCVFLIGLAIFLCGILLSLLVISRTF